MTSRAVPWLRLDPAVRILLLATLFLLPFERPTPLLALRGVVVTNLEAMLLLTLAVWLCDALPRFRSLHPPFFVWPAAAIVLSAFLAALAAPAFQANALKVAARWSLGVLFALALADTVGRTRASRHAFAAIVCGATTAAALGLLEMGNIPWAVEFLALFKDAPAQLGPAARLSATFGSGNAAAMLFETALCLALGLALDASYKYRRVSLLVWVACLGVLTAALALTYSRSGMAAAAVGMAVALALSIRYLRQREWRWLALTLASLGVVVAAVLAFNPVLRGRLAVWDARPLDAAVVAAPPTLAAEAGSVASVAVSVTNTGRLTWRTDGPDSVALSYHWLTEDKLGVVEWDNPRLPLPADVPPGGTVALEVALAAPVAGRYALAWDLVHAPNEWLGGREAMPGWTTVVTSGPGGTPFAPSSRGQAPAPPPDRAVLWRAALQMARERPILGVGPGNFRHLYGAYLGLATWDERILANNLYLEILADTGVVGFLAWGWLLASVAAHLWTSRRPSLTPLPPSPRAGEGGNEQWPFAIALLAAVAAWLTHGLTDVAFETTGIYLLLWALVGLAASLDAQPDVRP